jgi:hypothetical protein
MPLDARYAHWLQHPDDELVYTPMDAPDEIGDVARLMMQEWSMVRELTLDASEDD